MVSRSRPITRGQFTTATGTNPCSAPPNAIVAENCLPGNLPSEWDISGAGDTTIQGFATDISVNQGGTVNFKIKTPRPLTVSTSTGWATTVETARGKSRRSIGTGSPKSDQLV